MKRTWQKRIWLLFGSLVLCGWCSIISGFSGWIIGYDLGRRETRATFLPQTGVLVTRVERGGPADRAGIARGDMITAINGLPVRDVVELRDKLLHYRPGDNVMVTYQHNFRDRITYVVLERFPGKDSAYLGIYFTARAEEPADI